MGKKAPKKQTKVIYSKYKLYDLNTGEELAPETFADKQSAIDFALQFFPMNQDFVVEDRSGAPISPPPPPALATVLCFNSWKFNKQIKIL